MIPPISMVIWLERVHSWIFNSAFVGLAFLPPPLLLSFAVPALCLLVSALNVYTKQRLNTSNIQTAQVQTSRSLVLCNTVFSEKQTDVLCLGQRGIN